MSAIPTKVRVAVVKRSLGRCERCGGPGVHLHHRQRRREGGHKVENLVNLCPTDHAWAHANPLAAIDEGFILPTWIPVEEISYFGCNTIWGWRLLTTEGRYKEHEPETVKEEDSV